MADKYKKSVVLWWIYVLAMNFVSTGCVEGRNRTLESIFGPKAKGTVKTIEALEYNDVIDCVDIRKQPAFDDPRIRVEDLKMKPSKIPDGMFDSSENDGKKYVTKQYWNDYGECPKGTVPIRRTLTEDIHRRKFPSNKENHEYATISTQPYGQYKGATGSLNIWNPQVERGEFSLSQIWVVADFDYPENRNTIEAGWMVYPDRYRDSRPRYFVHWTADGYGRSGCYDLDCPGFIKVSEKFSPGASLGISTYDGEQLEFILFIHKDDEFSRWWLATSNREYLGYWPFSVFTFLVVHASVVTWGGEIADLKWFRHTTTQMGNGHFPSDGLRRACYTRNLKVFNSSEVLVDLDHPTVLVSDPHCYDIKKDTIDDKPAVFFGGAGRSNLCK